MTDWTAQTKNETTFDNGLYFLLQEIGDYLLQENGGKIVLQESWNFKAPTTWTGTTKNTTSWNSSTKNSTSWDGSTKNSTVWTGQDKS